MPSISTLQRYARKLDLKQGILNDKLIFIEIFAGEFSEIDRKCVLSFDEMKVCKNFEYDPAANEIIEPYSYLQVVMAWGLFRNWKQPIVSDNCQANVGCWKDFGAHNYLCPHFPHPVTKKKVHIFPDAPYLLKLIRNSLLDTGLKFKDNHISTHILRELVLERTKSETTLFFKLTQHHLYMSPQERKNVRKAAELIS